MPGMLGWFKMTPETSIEDIEWLLARSAGFDAGYALVADYEAIDQNGNTDKILRLIGQWEKLRLTGSFTIEQKGLLKDINNEFALEKITDTKWILHRVFSSKFKHEKKFRQPGEPLGSTFEFDNKGKAQTLHFILQAIESDISEIIMEIDNYKELRVPVTVRSGEIIKYEGGEKAIVYDKNWHAIDGFPVDPSMFKVTQGAHALTLKCNFKDGGEGSMCKLEIRTLGFGEKIVDVTRN
jgi:hypothetical protein